MWNLLRDKQRKIVQITVKVSWKVVRVSATYIQWRNSRLPCVTGSCCLFHCYMRSSAGVWLSCALVLNTHHYREHIVTWLTVYGVWIDNRIYWTLTGWQRVYMPHHCAYTRYWANAAMQATTHRPLLSITPLSSVARQPSQQPRSQQ